MDTPVWGRKKRCAPSKHSGESSLSPNEPSSSETMMSAKSLSGFWGCHVRMSSDTTVTLVHCSVCTSERSVTTAFAFFSTANTRGFNLNWTNFKFKLEEEDCDDAEEAAIKLFLFASRIIASTSAHAARDAFTSGPLPAPTTMSTTSIATTFTPPPFSFFFVFFVVCPSSPPLPTPPPVATLAALIAALSSSLLSSSSPSS
mmetsp:Transcript_6473/g.12087  ORF Transcript_6473/g.12087 Transcript_6473/m.12087 type:complete len:201 (+) Transcript_6473:645-1247(+)